MMTVKKGKLVSNNILDVHSYDQSLDCLKQGRLIIAKYESSLKETETHMKCQYHQI